MCNSDIAILKQMIQEDATVPLDEDEQEGNYFVRLIEPQSDYSVIITGMPKPEQVIIIKVDAFPAPRKIFQGSKGECKRADFVIVTNTGAEKFILCIEMKKKKGLEKAIIQQLMGAQCFVGYCKEIGKLFWKQKNFLDSYPYRFISIGYIPINKRKTQASRRKTSNQPERILKIKSLESVEFNYLVMADH